MMHCDQRIDIVWLLQCSGLRANTLRLHSHQPTKPCGPYAKAAVGPPWPTCKKKPFVNRCEHFVLVGEGAACNPLYQADVGKLKHVALESPFTAHGSEDGCLHQGVKMTGGVQGTIKSQTPSGNAAPVLCQP